MALETESREEGFDELEDAGDEVAERTHVVGLSEWLPGVR